jgi:hypothetical protein
MSVKDDSLARGHGKRLLDLQSSGVKYTSDALDPAKVRELEEMWDADHSDSVTPERLLEAEKNLRKELGIPASQNRLPSGGGGSGSKSKITKARKVERGKGAQVLSKKDAMDAAKARLQYWGRNFRKGLVKQHELEVKKEEEKQNLHLDYGLSHEQVTKYVDDVLAPYNDSSEGSQRREATPSGPAPDLSSSSKRSRRVLPAERLLYNNLYHIGQRFRKGVIDERTMERKAHKMVLAHQNRQKTNLKEDLERKDRWLSDFKRKCQHPSSGDK